MEAFKYRWPDSNGTAPSSAVLCIRSQVTAQSEKRNLRIVTIDMANTRMLFEEFLRGL
jgi:hypothetical protein